MPYNRVLADSAPDPILTIDETSVMLVANGGAERVFGYSQGIDRAIAANADAGAISRAT